MFFLSTEVIRRQWLEQNPQSSSNDEPVVFETSTIPWWAWVRRFHLPEAEKLNGMCSWGHLENLVKNYLLLLGGYCFR